MKESLPLFDDTRDVHLDARLDKRTGERACERTDERTDKQTEKRMHKRENAANDQHMAAAQRLARQFKRSKVKPRDRLRAGRLICRHLVAMLHDIEAAEKGQQNPH